MTAWMVLKGIIPNKISQTEKEKYCTILLICGIQKTKKKKKMNKNNKTETDSQTPREQTGGCHREGGWGHRQNRGRKLRGTDFQL